MRIIQVCTSVLYGDGVGNDIVALHQVILTMGYKTAIYAEVIDDRLRTIVHRLSRIPKLKDDDVIIYHLCIGTSLNYDLQYYKGRKVIIYHNITPPEYFKKYSFVNYRASFEGVKGMNHLAKVADYCIADSEFNKKDLLSAGYSCKIDTLPILIPLQDYNAEPDQSVIDKYTDGYTNLLFTGRIVPNKKQEDIISLFYCYQKYYNPRSRLFLAGSVSVENYERRLKDYIDVLGVKEVYFTGHISFQEILAYYHLADAFVCMSEHEGFCIPLIEAMYFGIPILAYNSSAVGETLGGCGFLTDTKDSIFNAAILNRILTDQTLKQDIIYNEKIRLKDFDNRLIEERFIRYLKTFLGNA